MKYFLPCIALLLAASATAGCTWTSVCEGNEKCEDKVYLDDHATGEGSASFVCSNALSSETPVYREVGGIATCKYTPEDGLFIQVGSSTCDGMTVVLGDFTGPGVYTTSDAVDAATAFGMYMVKPDTGCQKEVSIVQSWPIEYCSNPSDPCTIEVTGDVTPTQGGDMTLTIHCGRLAYNHGGYCGECVADAPFTLHIDDCELTE